MVFGCSVAHSMRVFEQVYALSMRTGQRLWRFQTGAEVYSSPTVSHGVVFFGSYDHKCVPPGNE